MKKGIILLLGIIICLSLHGTGISKSIPVLYVNTTEGEPITSKDVYVGGSYYLETFGYKGYENIGSEDSPLPLQIRYRGNWTLKKFDKKPYKIKFGSKTEILGMKKNKHFALLAHADARRGFLRNTVGFEISRLMGMDFTSEQRPVELVLNGSYEGLYFLTETVRVDKNRLEIDEQKDLEEDPAIIANGGWLVELDNYEDPNQIVFNVEGTTLPCLWVTYHTPENLSTQQKDYLSSEFESILAILRMQDYESDNMERLVDFDELAKYYLCSEIVDHQEAFLGSCFLHKDKGGKWRFGPVWDFGTAFIETHDKNKFIYEDNVFGNAGLIEYFIKFPKFEETVKSLYQHFRKEYYEYLFPFIDDFISEIKDAAISNSERWPQYGNGDIIERGEYVKDCLRQKISYLDSKWGGQVSGMETLQHADSSERLYDVWGNCWNKSLKDKQSLPSGIYIRKGNGNYKKYVVH